MILRPWSFLPLIKNAGVKDGPKPLIDEPLHMAVGQLGGIALGFRGDGLHAQLIDFSSGFGRKDHGKSQFVKEGGPERIVFIQVEHAGNADFAPGRLLFG